MMTYVKSVKDTIKNWFNENRTLGFMLIGMIGFPLALFVVGGAVALIIMTLSFFFGEFFGSTVFLMMTVGAVGGYLWGQSK